MISSLDSDRWTALTIVVVAVLAAVVITPAAIAQSQPVRSGRQVYVAACAACHGVDGRGMPRPTVGFEAPLPDFTECTFTSREPAADWAAIVHEGGPVRGFDRLMPAFGDALAWDEIELVVTHLKSFCDDAAWPAGELNLPRALATEKAFPEDEVVLTTSVTTEGSGVVANKLIYEQRFGARNQFEVIVPFSAHEDAGDWSRGIGDIAFGAKRAIYHEATSGTILSVAAEAVLPTGNEDQGFGKGFTVFEPFVSFGQILPADGFFQFQGGVEIPTDRDHPDEAFWRMVIGKSFVENRFGRTWSPMVELLGAQELTEGASATWDLLPGIQVTLPVRQHVMAAAGVRLPLNDTSGRSTQVVVYLLWDWFDGGLLEGWGGAR